MIGFIQLPYRQQPEPDRSDRLRSLMVGFTLGLVLLSQLALLLWAMAH